MYINPNRTEPYPVWEMHITAQGPRLRNDLYCVEWDVKPYYTISYAVWELSRTWTLRLRTWTEHKPNLFKVLSTKPGFYDVVVCIVYGFLVFTCSWAGEGMRVNDDAVLKLL